MIDMPRLCAAKVITCHLHGTHTASHARRLCAGNSLFLLRLLLQTP